MFDGPGRWTGCSGPIVTCPVSKPDGVLKVGTACGVAVDWAFRSVARAAGAIVGAGNEAGVTGAAAGEQATRRSVP